nr:reverse transcriptase domain-containing protein [Tanacetum cinerariifolium]
MQTRSSLRLLSNPFSNPTPSTNLNPKGHNRRRSKQRIEEFNLDEISPAIVTMADQRTMAQLLQAPTEGYEDAIVVLAITIDNFELKHELHQLDTFYNALNSKDQDSLNSAAGGNFLDKMPRECLAIIGSKSKVRYSRNKPVVAKVSTNTSTSGISPDVAELKDMVKALLLDKKGQNQSPATVKVVEESCVTCGGTHSYRNCPATDGNVYRDNIQEFVSQASTVNYNQGNTNYQDVYVKVGSFHFLADFVVVDFDADPRVPLILGRSFLKTERALIDVFKGELTLHVGKEAITFNLDQTSRYSANYNNNSINQIDVIEMACEEYSQEVLGDVIESGNPTPCYDPIVSTASLTLTPFKNSDFLLEEVDAFLKDDPTLPEELKIREAKSDKSLINEPPEVELKDLPPHLEYAFLEGDDKVPVIIAKDLSVEENTALITVLKSHKRTIAWKLSDIKGIKPEFYTHKVLMEDDFKPSVQDQRRVNPKIYDVIKQEVIKLLDAGLIYPFLIVLGLARCTVYQRRVGLQL